MFCPFSCLGALASTSVYDSLHEGFKVIRLAKRERNQLTSLFILRTDLLITCCLWLAFRMSPLLFSKSADDSFLLEA